MVAAGSGLMTCGLENRGVQRLRVPFDIGAQVEVAFLKGSFVVPPLLWSLGVPSQGTGVMMARWLAGQGIPGLRHGPMAAVMSIRWWLYFHQIHYRRQYERFLKELLKPVRADVYTAGKLIGQTFAITYLT